MKWDRCSKESLMEAVIFLGQPHVYTVVDIICGQITQNTQYLNGIYSDSRCLNRDGMLQLKGSSLIHLSSTTLCIQRATTANSRKVKFNSYVWNDFI